MTVSLLCIDCGRAYKPERRWQCECGGLLEVSAPDIRISRRDLDSRLADRTFPFSSGVWRYRELIHPLIADDQIISREEGNTAIYSHRKIAEYAGVDDIRMKHEGQNPTGSFKDRGMTVGVSEAVRLGCTAVGCASTGNTSASLASYAARAGLKALVFIPSGEIAYGKLSQSLAYGARTIQIKGNFDDSMALIMQACEKNDVYLLNSINPWRIEGQKAIAFELLQQLGWQSPDWIALPAGNLGNTSAMGKAIAEMKSLNLIEKIPRIASVQASGASPFYRMWKNGSSVLSAAEHPDTIATAIKIGNPVSWKRAMNVIKGCNGVVEEVTDQEIMDAKAVIDASGIGCEPASAASLAGVRKLRASGVIKRDERVVCILTGNMLKDPTATVSYHTNKLEGIRPAFANPPAAAGADLEGIMRLL